MVAERFPTDMSPDLKVELDDLRSGTLVEFVALSLGVLLLWVLRVVGEGYSMGLPDLAALVVLIVAATALGLRGKHPTWASWLFLLGITTGQGVMLLAYPDSLLPRTLGVLVIILANATLCAYQGLLAAIANWTLLATVLYVREDRSYFVGDSLEILSLNALTWIASYLAGRPLATATSWALAAWERARELLAETRQRRAEIYGVLRSLEEATYRIERMNNELLLARQQAEDARAIKARLVAIVSHELRNPLNLILGFSELMALHPENYGEPLPAPYYADVDVIYRNTRHLVALIDDILDLSRIEAQRLPLIKSLIDLEQDVVVRVGQTLRPLCERKGLFYREELGGNLPLVLADPVRLCQVLSNLITNAIRYTERGGIVVRTTLQEEEILISVTDTGPGIPEEDMSGLFKEFNRLVRTETRESAGTGLGLSISKQLIELHGGRVWVNSQVGVGTTVHCALPRPDATPRDKAIPGRPIRHRVEPHRACLVISEEPGLVKLLSRYVEGYRMVGVTRVNELPAAVEEIRPEQS